MLLQYFLDSQANVEEALKRFPLEKVFWKHALNFQENTHAEATLLKPRFGMGDLFLRTPLGSCFWIVDKN